MTRIIHGTGIFQHIWLFFYGKCSEIYHTWMVWVIAWEDTNVARCLVAVQAINRVVIKEKGTGLVAKENHLGK